MKKIFLIVCLSLYCQGAYAMLPATASKEKADDVATKISKEPSPLVKAQILARSVSSIDSYMEFAEGVRSPFSNHLAQHYTENTEAVRAIVSWQNVASAFEFSQDVFICRSASNMCQEADKAMLFYALQAQVDTLQGSIAPRKTKKELSEYMQKLVCRRAYTGQVGSHQVNHMKTMISRVYEMNKKFGLPSISEDGELN